MSGLSPVIASEREAIWCLRGRGEAAGVWAGVGLFLDDEEDGIAPAVGPLDEQRGVEFAKALAEAFHELLLPGGYDAGCGEVSARLFAGEEFQRLAEVVEDEILEA